MPRGVKKENLPSKVCVVCHRPFTWRKKWERCWDEVTTCSKACNAQRRRNNKASTTDSSESDEAPSRGAGGGSRRGPKTALRQERGREHETEEEEQQEEVSELTARSQRKAAKKAMKAAKRLKREGKAAQGTGQKPCDACSRSVDLLIRCTTDETQHWRMVCGKCWTKVSGGVTDGSPEHPHYRYGGLWKNRVTRTKDTAPTLNPNDAAAGVAEDGEATAELNMHDIETSLAAAMGQEQAA